MEIGKFITLEGGDGTGKTTQAKLLAESLKRVGIKAIATREPGGSELGEKLRNLLREHTSPITDPLVEAMLFFSARRQLLNQLIFPNLHSGVWVVCDRFYDSSLVYQGIMKDYSIENLMKIKELVMGNFEPDLTIILDIKTKDALFRINARKQDNSKKDPWDSMPEQYHQKVRESFLKLGEVFSFRSETVNASGTISAVEERIREVVFKKFLIKKS